MSDPHDGGKLPVILSVPNGLAHNRIVDSAVFCDHVDGRLPDILVCESLISLRLVNALPKSGRLPEILVQNQLITCILVRFQKLDGNTVLNHELPLIAKVLSSQR